MSRPRLLFAIAVACAAAAACKGKPKAASNASEPAPPFIVAPLPAGDPRAACASAPDFQPYGGRDEREKLREAFHDKRGDDAVRWAQALVKVNPCDIGARVLGATALEDLGRAAEAGPLREQAAALIKSLMSSGDGKTAATAFKVISPSEEHSVLMLLGFVERSQSLISAEGHQFDKLEVEDVRTKRTADLYFNVDIPMKRQVEIFGGKK